MLQSEADFSQKILELEKLALAICDPNYKNNEGVYTINEQIREIKAIKKVMRGRKSSEYF